MKKRILLASLILALTTSVHSQDLFSKIKKGVNEAIDLIDQDIKPTGKHGVLDLIIAPKIGLSANTLSGTTGKIEPGIMAGCYIEIFPLEQLAVDMEIYYGHQGINDVPHHFDELGYGEYDISLNYMNTSYMCRWYPIAEKPLSIYSGLTISNLVSARINGKGIHQGIKGDLHKGDFSIPIGVSYEWGQWQADIRYNHGLKRIASSPEMKSILGKGTNSSLALSIAYKIGIL